MTEKQKRPTLHKYTICLDFIWPDGEKDIITLSPVIIDKVELNIPSLFFHYSNTTKAWRISQDSPFSTRKLTVNEDWTKDISPFDKSTECDVLFNIIQQRRTRNDHHKCIILFSSYKLDDAGNHKSHSRWAFYGAYFRRMKMNYNLFCFEFVYERIKQLRNLPRKPTPLQIIQDRKDIGC